MTATAPDERAPADRLADALAPDEIPAYDEGEAATVLDNWTVENMDGATWAARKRARLLAKKDELRRVALEQASRIQDWIEGETARIDADLAFFEGRLEGFHRAAVDSDPKKNLTINLPDGTVLRSQKGKLAVEVDDLPGFVAWAEVEERAEELLSYAEPTPNKNAIASAFAGKAGDEPGDYPAMADGGEKVPGVKIVRKPRSYTISSPEVTP